MGVNLRTEGLGRKLTLDNIQTSKRNTESVLEAERIQTKRVGGT